jgi:hypothetical protein
MSIPSDVTQDNIIPTSQVFLASLGPDRMTPDASAYGKLVPLCPKHINHFQFSEIVDQVDSVIGTYNEGDSILIGNSSIILMIALTELFFYNAPIRVLSYDVLIRDFHIYTLNDTGSWTTTPTPTLKPSL